MLASLATQKSDFTACLAVGGTNLRWDRWQNIADAKALKVGSTPAFSVITQLGNPYERRIWQEGALLADGRLALGELAILDSRRDWICEHLSPFESLTIQLPFSEVRRFSLEHGRPGCDELACPLGTVDYVMQGISQAIVPALMTPAPSSTVFIEHLLLAMMTHLTQNYAGAYFPSQKSGVLSPWQEKAATEFLAAHTTNAFSLEELAATCHLSRSYFIKAFKKTFDRTPHRWLMEYRVSKVKEMLATDMAIVEIAIACGFSDQSHLTRVFAQVAGTSPGQWRRQLGPVRKL